MRIFLKYWVKFMGCHGFVHCSFAVIFGFYLFVSLSMPCSKLNFFYHRNICLKVRWYHLQAEG